MKRTHYGCQRIFTSSLHKQEKKILSLETTTITKSRKEKESPKKVLSEIVESW